MMKRSPNSNLAIELVLDILEILAADEARLNGKTPPSLINTALVCRAWAPISQSLLFRNVVLGTQGQSIQFLNAIHPRTEKAHFLRANIKSLEVLVSDEEDGRIITQAAFANILKLCPNVADLRLFYYCLRPLDRTTIDILRTVPAPSSLSLRSAQHPSPLWDLLSIWPTVQHLEVALWESPSIHTTQPPKATNAQQWAPYEVRWLDESDSGEDWALPHLLRPGSLRILQLLRIPSDDYFEDLMKKHGPYLRSLRLCGPGGGSVSPMREEIIPSLKNCTSLEEFKYMRIPSRNLLQALPPSLEHLQFQNNNRKPTSIRSLLEWIEFSEKSRRLRVVTYNSCGDPLSEELRRLVEICRRRGIVLKCYADNPPMEEREPLIRPLTFPRPVPDARRKIVDPSSSAAGTTPKDGSGSSLHRRSPDYPSGRLRKGSSPDGGVFGIKLGL
ncbi:uncharacterized protein EI90DRAFT_3090449 [Cantharellus anzutake]|uniref:uncharacterized protein n=1 Tax=Cantharellus anzutake TaxID=1750568 RepID=UPI001904AA01|nr:uncharacterized protein EI90DRAFT_3090449 [Cantharellus anzutake]KAF8314358.1 hypothetical protein EI90DRAFT_3090449 [Cantharellus anzutake]